MNALRRALKKQGGFTLVELIIVIVIIGVLSTIAVPMYTKYVQRAKAAEGIALCGAVASAERAYFAEYNAYYSYTSPASGAGNRFLPVDAGNNTYYKTWAVVGDANSFTITANGSGDMAAIPITYAYTNGGTPTINYTLP